MNKKGFTLIELITTFALSTVIIILLINIIVLIKNIYTQNNVRSELLIEQSNLSYLINKKFTSGSLMSYTPCYESNYCYNFNFLDGTISTLVVADNYIRFDNYVYNLKDGISILSPTLEIIEEEVTDTSVNNSFLVIKVPIKSKLYPEQDFGFGIVYQYNSKKITL